VKRRVKHGDKFARCLVIINIKENGRSIEHSFLDGRINQ